MAKSVRYFAYGSNLWSERIRIRNPSAIAISAALLKGHRLEFVYTSDRWKGSVANIYPDPNFQIYGVLWDLQHNDLCSLDEQEGVAEGNYERTEITVEANGEIVKCLSYRVTDVTRKQSISVHGENQKPSKIYKEVMVCGAKENNLPLGYITNLENIVDNGYDGEVEVNIPRHCLRRK